MGLGQDNRGYAMAALLVGLSVAAVLMSAALPVWSHYVKREKEEELIWRGQQYARAIGLFQRKYANAFPPTVDVLVEQKFLRKKYKDPVTGEDFQPIPATGMPGGGIVAMPGMPVVPGAGGGAGQPDRTAPGSGGQPPRPVGQQPRPVGQQPRPVGQPARPPGQMTSIGTTVQAGVGIQGVVSKSDKSSIKIYNGRTKYNEWAFVYMAASQNLGGGAAGFPNPGLPNQPGVPNQPGLFGRPAVPNLPGAQNPGATPFAPLGGTDRRPGAPSGMSPGGTPPGGSPRTPSPFGTPPRPPGS